jgi:hypothetical protein
MYSNFTLETLNDLDTLSFGKNSFPNNHDEEEDIEVCNTKTGMDPNIATSVHLLFSKDVLSHKMFNKMKRNWWIIENTIVVEKTVSSTYFGVIQLPGIYAGLQQLPSSECNGDDGEKLNVVNF